MINRDEFTIYASDLLRAKQTAEIIGGKLELAVHEEDQLREINTGEAAGKTKEWARQNRNPRTSDGFDIDYQQFPGGETYREFYNRVCNCMTRLYNSEEKNLLISTHGGTMGYIIAWWMGFKPEMLASSCFIASVGSLSILQVNGYQQHILKVFNDTCHLSEM
ncbi:MAG: Phosphoglycerate mutase [Paenibacillaceae bacterium]|jgi:probable phosphoglycerate mutase|nr:Phosphoglycerate mutase [Paenibacillaceae bacterium]